MVYEEERGSLRDPSPEPESGYLIVYTSRLKGLNDFNFLVYSFIG